VVKKHLAEFDTFVSSSHFVLKVILSSLSAELGVTGPDSLQNFHRDDQPSKSSVFFLHYPPRSGEENIGQNMHTDLGSLTLLFAAQWGLQVLCPSDTQSKHTEVQASCQENMEWKFVEPRPNHAIINIGDSLRFLTKCRLRSALHRVLPLYDTDRYSVTYFLRPSDDATFVDSDGEVCDAMKWYLKKNSTYESSYQAQAKSSVLLGGIQNHSSIHNGIAV
jgi:isopenicillin N synthase-like dioxygenase